jgi:hypothetical protein
MGAYLLAPVGPDSDIWYWLIGGIIANDAILALILVLLSRFIHGWVIAPSVVSGVLMLVAVPTLWRMWDGGSLNPGLHDGNYVLALAISLAVIWTTAVAYRISTRHRSRA